MRILDEEGVEVPDPDLEAGFLAEVEVVRPDAAPVDDIAKFAWADEDYERALRYVRWKPGERESAEAARDEESRRAELVATAPERIAALEASTDDVLLLMADMIGGAL